jgi:hypothetical protein
VAGMHAAGLVSAVLWIAGALATMTYVTGD